jgi:putative DNA primase/helicase
VIDLRSLQRALGDEINSGQLLCPGPGHSRNDRSLSVRPTPDGRDFVVFSHAGDDFRDCRDYVRERLGWPRWQPGDERNRRVAPSRLKAFDRAALDAESGPRPRTADELTRIARAAAIWGEAEDPRGTLVEKYLASRALILDDAVAGNVLRYHPACPWRDENSGRTIFIAALIACFTSIDDGAVTAVHRIRLDQPERWPKTERMMLGVVRRAAVMLDQANGTLAVGEGIETCLAGRQLGYAPAWALGSVGNITRLPVLDGVQQLSILGETGEASAGAVRECGARWHAAGRKVRVVMPSSGSDLNDELMAAAS